MHPAPSLIVFTTLSGLGFGLMVFLGLGVPDVSGWVAAVFCALALGLAGGGLLASTLHLGSPGRAWRAFSQWRSSWLSREAVAAVAASSVFAVYGAAWSLFDARLPALGLAASVLALATVLATAMIYAQLRTVPRWRHWSTPALFALAALGGGAALAAQTDLAAALITALWALQVWAWRRGDRAFAASGSTLETATGLGALGRMRMLEPPHTGQNYLTREMVFVVGRRRSRALRLLALLLGGAIPVFVFATFETLPFKHGLAALAIVSHVLGVACARWLFFAEAEHVTSLYYGRPIRPAQA